MTVMMAMMDGSVSVGPQTGVETVMQGSENAWQNIGTLPDEPLGGMLLFKIVTMVTPLGSTILNVMLCAADGALFAFGLGAIGKAALKKTSLI